MTAIASSPFRILYLNFTSDSAVAVLRRAPACLEAGISCCPCNLFSEMRPWQLTYLVDQFLPRFESFWLFLWLQQGSRRATSVELFPACCINVVLMLIFVIVIFVYFHCATHASEVHVFKLAQQLVLE